MLRMSLLEHMEELRARIIWMLGGVAAAFAISLTFCSELWLIVQAPAEKALTELGIDPPHPSAINTMDQFNIIYVKLPILVSIFIASPWILYQIWSFVAPGLYPAERKWCAPFVCTAAGLFIFGGLFAYFEIFPRAIVFLLGIGRDVKITPIVSLSDYFDLFVNVILGVGLIFETPIVIFFLTLLHLVTPQFLLRNSRYAILLIAVIAALLTPTGDAINLTLLAVPMIFLYYVGAFASWILVLNRDHRAFAWKKILIAISIVALAGALAIQLAKRMGWLR